MKSVTLWQRLSLLFAALLLACFGTAAWLQMDQSQRYVQRVEQHLLRALAMHIATDLTETAHAAGLPAPLESQLKDVVMRLRATNPGVELYVLDGAGRIRSRFPQDQPLLRRSVALAPLQGFLAGEPPPILGDDPLQAKGSKVFSAARQDFAGVPGGYVYAVLQGAAYDMAAADAGHQQATRTALWSVGLVTPLGLVAGLLAFRLVTRPLAQLTREVQAQGQAQDGAAAGTARHATADGGAADEPVRDEIVILRRAFVQLARSNDNQWRKLNRQDQERREWIANISHDLRTPLASMQGYLETLLLQQHQLSNADQTQYLRTALDQSQRLGRLANELLELARLELGTVKPAVEDFALDELAYDVLNKLALSASSRQQRLVPEFAPALPRVAADIGMIERVLTNLLDNAIRHTPPVGRITLRLLPQGGRVRVEVADEGPGIAPARHATLFARPTSDTPGREGNGLGLAIVRQILQLHGSDVALVEQAGAGAVFAFTLPSAA